jgi:hypothetical protein
MSKLIAIETIQSMTTKRIYADAGEELELLSDKGGIILVRGKRGTFPVPREKTSIDGATLKVPEVKPEPEAPTKRRSYGAPKTGRRLK